MLQRPVSRASLLPVIAEFLNRIGLPAREGAPDTAFLEGVSVRGGVIVYAPDAHPGNILHEAGHVAVTPSRFRALIETDLDALAPHYRAYLEEHSAGMCSTCAINRTGFR